LSYFDFVTFSFSTSLISAARKLTENNTTTNYRNNLLTEEQDFTQTQACKEF